MPAIEFPANAYPWLALEKRGVRVVLVQPRDGRVTAEQLAGACTARTRWVTVSFVQFSNGYRIDVAALGRFCRDRGIFLHVNGIQSLGMLRCDVRAMSPISGIRDGSAPRSSAFSNLRMGAIRLAPHFYNTGEEAARVLDLL